MSPAAFSVYIFGIYLIVLGTGLLVIPNTLLSLFKFPKTEEPWIRVIGMLVLTLAFYYIMMARNEFPYFFWLTIVARLGVFIGFIGLVLFKKAKPMLILFGLIDAVAAIWTMLAAG